jgi:DNA modification methylase
MFSFVGDTVLDPFVGTGTTMVAAARAGRNSVGVEIDPEYYTLARDRLNNALPSMTARRTVELSKW